MNIEPCPQCGNKMTSIKPAQKLISCKCGMPWLSIELWNEMSKAIRHYRHCDKRDGIKTDEVENTFL